MEFWLTYNNGKEKFQLPVPPPNYSVKNSTAINTVNINDFGEFALIGKQKLKDIPPISSFFPNRKYSFCQYSGFPKPYECVALIEKWRSSGKPIRLVITNTNINLSCCIEDFEYGERDGTSDVYFTLSLKEYRYQNAENVTSTNKASSTRPVEDKLPATYKVKAGDTLYTIAKKIYGNGSLYTTLMKKNKIKDANLIHVGQVLIL